MIDILTIKWFYPLLFTTITIIAVVLILAIKTVLIKFKDSDLFQNIFNKHTDEHIDTTDKMKDMHDNIIKVDFTKTHEKELDYIEKKVDKIEKDIIEINDKLDAFIQKVIELENRK